MYLYSSRYFIPVTFSFTRSSDALVLPISVALRRSLHSICPISSFGKYHHLAKGAFAPRIHVGAGLGDFDLPTTED